MSISFTTSGSFKNTENFLNRISRGDIYRSLNSLAAKGTVALRNATPKDSGNTADAWYHEVKVTRTGATISWLNSNTNSGVNIAIILQYGHGTGTGGYVAGRDYINPAIRPIFDEIANAVWKEVTRV